MIRLRKLINAFPIVALLAFPSGISAAAGATPEQLIASFSDAPNPDAVFYAINKASGTDPAPVRKAALAHIGDSEPQTVLTDQRRCKFGHALDLQVTVLQ